MCRCTHTYDAYVCIVYVCMHVQVCVYVYPMGIMHVCMYVCMYVYMPMCMWICVCMCMNVRVCVCMNVCMYACPVYVCRYGCGLVLVLVLG